MIKECKTLIWTEQSNQALDIMNYTWKLIHILSYDVAFCYKYCNFCAANLLIAI